VTYRSAIDAWVLLVLGGGTAVAIVSSGAVLVAGDASTRVAALLAAAFGVGLPAWILLSTSYTLTAEDLVVRSGPFRWRLPIADITAIVPTRNPLSSPALSLNRLRITTRGRADVMISPADRAGFLADLEARRTAAGSGDAGR
jgi:hypothetical protein